MIKHIFLCILTVFCILKANAQTNTNESFGFINDNDLYVSFTLDEYYTNGLSLFYKRAFNTNNKYFDKKIREIKVGQNIYNPFDSDVPSLYNVDRPYAGYLYMNYTEHFIDSKNILSIGLEFGLTGKKTMAEGAQNFIHQFYDIDESEGWNHQVKEQMGMGIRIDYTRSLFYSPDKKLQISSISNATINSIFTNFYAGIAIKINNGSEETTPISNSSFFGTALQTEGENWIKQCYWGIKSYVTYQNKDKTVTGKLQDNYLQKNFNLTPWVWHNDIGYYWNLKRWNISYHQIFHTQNIKEIAKNWIRYGSIQLAYKF